MFLIHSSFIVFSFVFDAFCTPSAKRRRRAVTQKGAAVLISQLQLDSITDWQKATGFSGHLYIFCALSKKPPILSAVYGHFTQSLSIHCVFRQSAKRTKPGHCMAGALKSIPRHACPGFALVCICDVPGHFSPAFGCKAHRNALGFRPFCRSWAASFLCPAAAGCPSQGPNGGCARSRPPESCSPYCRTRPRP